MEAVLFLLHACYQPSAMLHKAFLCFLQKNNNLKTHLHNIVSVRSFVLCSGCLFIDAVVKSSGGYKRLLQTCKKGAECSEIVDAVANSRGR